MKEEILDERKEKNKFFFRPRWKFDGWCFFAGLLLVLAFPYPAVFPLAWVGLVPLFVSIYRVEPSLAFWRGFGAGVVFYFGLIYWVVVAIYRYGGAPFFLSLIPLVILVVYLACFWGVFAWSLTIIERNQGVSLVIAAPLVWVTLEEIRAFLLSGFPWENLGYSQYRWLSLIQVAEWTGVEGVSFVLVFANAVIWEWIRFFRKEVTFNKIIVPTLVLVGLWGGILFLGFCRLEQLHEKMGAGLEVRVGIIQGNISQDQKWLPEYQEETLKIYFALSQRAVAEGAQFLVWPETATPFYFEQNDYFRAQMEQAVRSLGVPLLFGSPAYDSVEKGKERRFNSAFLLTEEGKVGGRYDKVHLVPFSEYYPLGGLFKSLRRYIEGIGDFTPGEGIHNLEWKEKKVGVLICYEAIFPLLARQLVLNGAEFIANITNDAWFGKTSAPYQHHSMVVFRAIENRIPIVRAANSGISSVIHPTGEIGRRLPLFYRGYLVEKIQPIPERPLTFYTRYGGVFSQLLAVGGVLVLVLSIWKKKTGGKRICFESLEKNGNS